jgi:hypothetical protein
MEDQSTPAPYTDCCGASYLVGTSSTDLCLNSTSPRACSEALQPPSVVLKETPESRQGCALPSSRDPHKLRSQGAGTHYPTGLSSLISPGPPEMLRENNRPARTQVVGGKEDLFTLADQCLDLSKMAPAF